MNRDAEKSFDDRGIKLHYLVKTEHDTYAETAGMYKEDGTYYPADKRNYPLVPDKDIHISKITAGGFINARRLNKGQDYLAACEHLYQEISAGIAIGTEKNILVLGTEEFMYPALFVAEKLEEKGNIVKCHSTTRSPVAVSRETEYPLHERYELASLYDSDRVTYIYDLKPYDEVMIITDSGKIEPEGINSLINAVCSCGNNHITLVEWRL